MNGIFGFGRAKNGALTNVPHSLLRNRTETEAETLTTQATILGVPRSVYNFFFNGGELNRAVELLTPGHPLNRAVELLTPGHPKRFQNSLNQRCSWPTHH